jgi:hypothetical protein
LEQKKAHHSLALSEVQELHSHSQGNSTYQLRRRNIFKGSADSADVDDEYKQM